MISFLYHNFNKYNSKCGKYMSLDLCLKQLHVHINVFRRIQYIRSLLFYSVIFQSGKFSHPRRTLYPTRPFHREFRIRHRWRAMHGPDETADGGQRFRLPPPPPPPPLPPPPSKPCRLSADRRQ